MVMPAVPKQDCGRMHERYNDRFYRQWMVSDALQRFQIQVQESDLLVLCSKKMKALAVRSLKRVRSEIENYISHHRDFADSLEPMVVGEDAPRVILRMARAADYWQVGPMAAVKLI